MIRELLFLPIRVADTVVGGVVGVIRSQLGEDATASPDTSEAPSPPPPEPAHRDPSAGNWAEDAPVAPGGSSPDDLVVTDRVKSELFAVVDAPKGDLNLNVENGVLFIRGHLEDPALIDDVVTLAQGIEGVVRVENLISS